MTNKVNNPLTHDKLVRFANRLTSAGWPSFFSARHLYSEAGYEFEEKFPYISDNGCYLYAGLGGCAYCDKTRTSAELRHSGMTLEYLEALQTYCPKGYKMFWNGDPQRTITLKRISE